MFAHIPRWLRLVVYVQTALVVAIPLGSWLLQKQGESRDMAAYPAPGKLVEAAGTRIHLHCLGESKNGPTIVFTSDMGDHGLIWRNVQSQTAAFARSCVIDRPGFGWSAPGADDRSITRSAQDLAAVLQSSGESGPYVLVGHGLGALHMAAFAMQNPQRSVGAVLVDPLAPVCLKDRFDSIVRNVEGEEKEAIRTKLDEVIEDRGPCPEGEGGTVLYSWLARIGMIRALAGDNFNPTSPSPELLPVHRALKMRTAFADASVQESKTAYVGMAEAREGLQALRGKPVEILSRGRMGNFAVDEDYLVKRADKATLAFERAQLKAVHQEHQQMAEAAGARVSIVENAPHYVQLARPDVVVSAIRRVWQAAQPALN